jgi:hypothetical protein
MSIKWIEGWRYRAASGQLELDYTIAGAGTLAVAELSARRTGCYAATLTTKTVKRAISLSSGTRVITEFAVKWVSGAGTLLHIMEGSTTHCSIGITSGGVLTAYRGTNAGTSLGTGATLVSGTVYHLTVDVTVHDSTGAVTVYVDDVSSIALTSQDTRNGGTPVVDGIQIEGNSGGVTFADWVIIDPSAAAGRTTKIGSGARVDCRLPIANGAKADCTAVGASTNYAAVDEDGYDGDTTYVQSQVAAARDLYSVTQMTHNPAAVYATQINLIAKKADSASRSLKPVWRNESGSTTPGATTALTTSYASIVGLSEDNGTYDDAGAWTQQAFNGRQFGFEIV